MRISSMVEIITDIKSNPNNYEKGRRELVQYIVIHCIGMVGTTAREKAEYFTKNIGVLSAHYFVDGTSIYQYVEDEDTAWHCGLGTGIYKHKMCRNCNSIGIDLCCKRNGLMIKREDSKCMYIEKRTVNNGIQLVKMLMKKYNVKIENVVRHYDVTEKPCPAPFVHNEEAWKNFKVRLTERG